MRFYRYDSYRGDTPEDVDSFSQSDLTRVFNPEEHKDNELFFMPDYMSGSDYSGDAITKANYNSFIDEFDSLLHKGIWKVYGDYGTYSIAIRKDIYETNEEVKECLDALEDYPLIDDEELCRVEEEEKHRYFEDNILSEIINGAYNEFEEKYDVEHNLSEILDKIPKEKYRELFEKHAEEQNEHWIIETGCNAYISSSKIVPHMMKDIEKEIVTIISPAPDAEQLDLFTEVNCESDHQD